MTRSGWRAVGVAASAVIGTAIGIATNVITSQWSWTWGTALVALLLSMVAIQVALTIVEERRARQAGVPPTGQASPSIKIFSATVGGHGSVHQGDSSGMSGNQVVLSLAIIGFLALGLVVWLLPSHGAGKEPTSAPSPVLSGDPLRLTLTGVDNRCHAVVLPESVGDRAKQFVEITRQPSDPGRFMHSEIDAGGYAHESIVVRLNAQTALPQEVTISNIRVVDLVVSEPVKGAFVDLHTCGGDEVNGMVIHINSPDRRPFSTGQYGSATDEPFFDSTVVNVAPAKKQSFVVRIAIVADHTAGSYRFRLAFDYEIDGKNATAIVDNDGHPFRLTGGCQWTSVTAPGGTTNELMRQLDPKQYGSTLCG